MEASKRLFQDYSPAYSLYCLEIVNQPIMAEFSNFQIKNNNKLKINSKKIFKNELKN